ncbi:MAG: DAK2 domain-containing protein [Tissierellales bacterium]|jgi:DAK2 domain fusion protein YloV|nr:DAK2 domain-containing protein [Tissierellales bacterium]
MINYIDGDLLKRALVVAAKTLEENKEVVNALNVFPVPDGDTGTNMARTFNAAVDSVISEQSNEVGIIAASLANGALMGARGNSGVILSQIFRGFAKGLKDCETMGVKEVAIACDMARETSYKAVMKPVEGTVLTVTRMIAEKAMRLKDEDIELVDFLRALLEAGEDSLIKTTDMLEQLRTANVVDAGGKGLMLILKGAFNTIIGKETVELEEIKPAGSVTLNKESANGDLKYRYCTGFMIKNKKDNADVFRRLIESFGDSIVVAETDDVIKVHIHSNHPGEILEKALKFGEELIDINIDNMRYQHETNHSDGERDQDEVVVDKKYSIIAVSSGEGISKVFKDMGAEAIISGGQTMNPSTEDIVKAIESVRGENVIILPNNKNIIMSAEQSKELTERNVYVVPSKTIPQGVASMVAFQEDLEAQENVDSMIEVLSEVKTGQLTYAVRETEINDLSIKENDIMGISDGEIVRVGEDLRETTLELIDYMADDFTDIITVFYGEDVERESAEELIEEIEKRYEDIDIELIEGGQSVYYYLISVE